MAFGRRKRAADEHPIPEQRGATAFTSGTMFGFYGGDRGPREALKSAAHWACIRVLCTSMAKLPVDQVRYRADGSREVMATPSQIVRKPSSSVSRRGFVYQVMSSWLEDGNAYGNVLNPTSMGLPGQIETIDPSCVDWRMVGNRQVPYVDNKPRDVWPNGDLWHSAAFLRAGSPVGLSPQEHGATAIRTAIEAERFGADFFTDGAHPTMGISVKGLADDKQAEQIKARAEQWKRDRGIAVFSADSMTVERYTVDPKDSQFIELLRFEVEQACRLYGVPPSMVFGAVSGSSITYANVTQDDLAYLKHSLDYWVDLFQDEWSAWLPSPQVVRFNTGALLRMTELQRHELYSLRLGDETMSVNDVHRLEDEAPVADPRYDRPGVPGVVDGTTLKPVKLPAVVKV